LGIGLQFNSDNYFVAADAEIARATGVPLDPLGALPAAASTPRRKIRSRAPVDRWRAAAAWSIIAAPCTVGPNERGSYRARPAPKAPAPAGKRLSPQRCK
jgi:hypothetical protein